MCMDVGTLLPVNWECRFVCMCVAARALEADSMQYRSMHL